MLDTFKHKGQRERLAQELAAKGITDKAVLDAIRQVPRHLFVEGVFADQAYEDKALPIKETQTISQPFTVAYQTQLLALKSKMKVLEIGTGSGYQAAVLAKMGMRVFSVEIISRLHRDAKRILEELGLKINLLQGDGSLGWNKFQPFERILVTAACPSIPRVLQQQLEIGGIMVIPVGDMDGQRMTMVKRKSKHEFSVHTLKPFKFVPLRGRYGFREANNL